MFSLVTDCIVCLRRYAREIAHLKTRLAEKDAQMMGGFGALSSLGLHSDYSLGSLPPPPGILDSYPMGYSSSNPYNILSSSVSPTNFFPPLKLPPGVLANAQNPAGAAVPAAASAKGGAQQPPGGLSGRFGGASTGGLGVLGPLSPSGSFRAASAEGRFQAGAAAVGGNGGGGSSGAGPRAPLLPRVSLSAGSTSGGGAQGVGSPVGRAGGAGEVVSGGGVRVVREGWVSGGGARGEGELPGLGSRSVSQAGSGGGSEMRGQWAGSGVRGGVAGNGSGKGAVAPGVGGRSAVQAAAEEDDDGELGMGRLGVCLSICMDQ